MRDLRMASYCDELAAKFGQKVNQVGPAKVAEELENLDKSWIDP